MKKIQQLFCSNGEFNYFLKISHEDRTDSLFPKKFATFKMSFKKQMYMFCFFLSWWLAPIQYTDGTETAVVAFIFSVSRTQFCAVSFLGLYV